MSEPTIAVLGLGAMGLPMATRLAEAFDVRGFDPDPARCAGGEEAGLSLADSAREAAEDADAVLLAVRDGAQLEEVLFGDEGVCAVLPRGALVILTSTVGVEAAREVARMLTEQGLHLVDAPVSGGPLRAGSGDLLVVTGATDEAYAAAEPMLRRLSSSLQRIGDAPGDGQAMKTVNQLLCGVHIAAAAEALALAGALGLDRELALECLDAGAASSFMLADRGPRILAAYDDEPVEVRSTVGIFAKDMGIVARAAHGAGLPTPVAGAAHQLFLTAAAQGLTDNDDSSVVTVVAPKAP